MEGKGVYMILYGMWYHELNPRPPFPGSLREPPCLIVVTGSPSFPSRMNFQSALARFLGGGNWGGDRKDWTVPLGPFAEGRPRLPPGRRGEFIPVFEDQPTTIIAYRSALASRM